MASANMFQRLGLSKSLVKQLDHKGFTTPTEVQQQSIPTLLKGCDIIALAQTGTGKTAAFALPILDQLVLDTCAPQALIIAPTRELAIQVADAMRSFSEHLDGLVINTVYGGQDYRIQLQKLKKGSHVVVGTPGRIMDHMRRGTLVLDNLSTLVLDEADEMLRMGFIEDIEWILSHVEHKHQTALFSATMPAAVKRVAKQFLKNPANIHVTPNVATVEAIEQIFMVVSRKNKLEALSRFLEVENPSASIIFTGTKTMSAEVADRLTERGYSAAALNGDMSQSLREQVMNKLKSGKLDMIIATEVAARGLDVERISHVINYDIPNSPESYIHRIGRTGRAGREGKALLLVAQQEQRMLNSIAKAVDYQLQEIQPPSVKQMRALRQQKLLEKLQTVIAESKNEYYEDIVGELIEQSNLDAKEIAAAALRLYYFETTTPLHDITAVELSERSSNKKTRSRPPRGGRQSKNRHPAERRQAKRKRKAKS